MPIFLFDSAIVHLAPSDTEIATIPFDTAVAQGSITSLQLLNIFINALLRMLTAAGQNQAISHGLRSVMVCRLARTRMTAVKTPTMAISLMT
jgi:hypothetical protein